MLALASESAVKERKGQLHQVTGWFPGIWDSPLRSVSDSSPLIWGEHAVQHWPRQSWHYFTVSTCFPFSLEAKLEKQKLSGAWSPHTSYFNMALQPLSITSQQERPSGAFPRAPLWCHPVTVWPHRYPYSSDTGSGPQGDKKILPVTFRHYSCNFEHYCSKRKSQNWINELLS